MERVQHNEQWSLFCPNEAPGLADSWGDTFQNLNDKYALYSILSRWPKMYNNPATYVIFRGRQWMWLQHRPPLVWYFSMWQQLSYEMSRVEVFEPSSGETKSDCCRGLLFDKANHCMSQQMVILFLTCHSNNGVLAWTLIYHVVDEIIIFESTQLFCH
jgi:hypothetical protein